MPQLRVKTGGLLSASLRSNLLSSVHLIRAAYNFSACGLAVGDNSGEQVTMNGKKKKTVKMVKRRMWPFLCVCVCVQSKPLLSPRPTGHLRREQPRPQRLVLAAAHHKLPVDRAAAHAIVVPPKSGQHAEGPQLKHPQSTVVTPSDHTARVSICEHRLPHHPEAVVERGCALPGAKVPQPGSAIS